MNSKDKRIQKEYQRQEKEKCFNYPIFRVNKHKTIAEIADRDYDAIMGDGKCQ